MLDKLNKYLALIGGLIVLGGPAALLGDRLPPKTLIWVIMYLIAFLAFIFVPVRVDKMKESANPKIHNLRLLITAFYWGAVGYAVLVPLLVCASHLAWPLVSQVIDDAFGDPVTHSMLKSDCFEQDAKSIQSELKQSISFKGDEEQAIVGVVNKERDSIEFLAAHRFYSSVKGPLALLDTFTQATWVLLPVVLTCLVFSAVFGELQVKPESEGVSEEEEEEEEAPPPMRAEREGLPIAKMAETAAGVSRRCIVPISVSNDAFRTSNFLGAVESLAREYDLLLFLIADQLQLYNKVSVVSEAQSYGSILALFRERNNYKQERKKWINRLRGKLSEEVKPDADWDTLGIDDFTDGKFFEIYRNVLILFNIHDEFRKDVRKAAREHAAERKAKGNGDTQDRPRISVCYLLEEIALNLRVRVCEQITAECYAGDTLVPLLKLYGSKYGISVFELTGIEPYDLPFDFFRLENTPEGVTWVLVG